MNREDQANISKLYKEGFYMNTSNKKDQLAKYQHPNAAPPALTFSKTANGPGAGKHYPVTHSSNEESAEVSDKEYIKALEDGCKNLIDEWEKRDIGSYEGQAGICARELYDLLDSLGVFDTDMF
jgi:hypothetical protein